MKKRKDAFGTIKKVVAMVMAAVIVFSLTAPMNVQAKTKVKSVTLKSHVQEFTVPYVKKAAKVTLKKGTYNIRINKSTGSIYRGYAAFTAPSTKTYSFIISNVKAANKSQMMGWISGSKQDADGGLSECYFSTKGGKTTELREADKKYDFSPSNLKNRTGKLKLQKGETLYLYFSFTGGSVSPKYMTTKFQIK